MKPAVLLPSLQHKYFIWTCKKIVPASPQLSAPIAPILGFLPAVILTVQLIPKPTSPSTTNMGPVSPPLSLTPITIFIWLIIPVAKPVIMMLIFIPLTIKCSRLMIVIMTLVRAVFLSLLGLNQTAKPSKTFFYLDMTATRGIRFG